MNGSRTFVLAAGVWALTSSAAFAADMPLLERAPVIEEFGGWYLRGDIGMTNQRMDKFDYDNMYSIPGFKFLDKGSFDSGLLFGLGVGYQFNGWLRGDITGEYRGRTAFRALDVAPNAATPTGWQTNEYQATKTEWLFLANAYVDIGTWLGVTPFIGAGIGFADVTLDNYRDINLVTQNMGYASSNSQTNFAWALYAGLAYQITPALTAEFAYRYVDLGSAKTGPVSTYVGFTRGLSANFDDITSQDVKVALRWQLGGSEAPPVVRKY